MRIITFSSLKGGVGKTTTAALLAVALFEKKYKVLVIDLDANNNMTDYFLRNIDPEEINKCNIYHVLKADVSLEKAICYSDIVPIDVIPAAPLLSKITFESGGDPGVVLRFSTRIKKLDYDYIIIDTPPALGLELRAALYSSDLVIVPIALNRWVIQGYDLVVDEVNKVREAIGRAPDVRIIPVNVSDVESLKLRELLPELPFMRGFVPKNPAMKNAGTNATIPRPGSAATVAFEALALEVV